MQSIGYNDRVETFYYTGEQVAKIKQAMDETLKEAEAKGGTLLRRSKIGRNAACPCGSGVKFKKCCINRAQAV